MFAFQEVEQADIETQESVIRVVSPTDVQFKLDDQDKEEVTFTTTTLHHFPIFMAILIWRTYANDTSLTLIEQVVVNLTSPEALCLDTAAFVGVTISFLMLLVIAFITIIFLWLR